MIILNVFFQNFEKVNIIHNLEKNFLVLQKAWFSFKIERKLFSSLWVNENQSEGVISLSEI